LRIGIQLAEHLVNVRAHVRLIFQRRLRLFPQRAVVALPIQAKAKRGVEHRQRIEGSFRPIMGDGASSGTIGCEIVTGRACELSIAG
jgi:hypothetical protein